MHFFNRFYLLFSIVFSFLVPFISIKTKVVGLSLSETINITSTNVQNAVFQPILPLANNNISFSDILLIIYLAVTAFLFCRFIINILTLLIKIRKSILIQYGDGDAKLVLTNNNLVPHSFLKYIFVDCKDFENGSIEKEILGHELTHVKQKHSIDILLIELFVIFAWINPLLFIYKRAIQLNHEFLADEYVVNSFRDTDNYQLLLLSKATQTINPIFSSPFNYLITKKRIIMMSKKASFRTAIVKQIALIPMIAAIVFLFTTKTIAQDHTKAAVQQVESTQNGVSKELLKEYQDILNKYKRTTKDDKAGYFLNLSQTDKERLETIFFQMSREQQAKQMFVFIPRNSMVLPKIVPTKEQLESFKDPKMYGVWINGEKVNNEVLSSYKNTDFAHVMESKLMKNATNYGKYVYQVDLMTNDGYLDYYNKTTSETGYVLIAPGMVTK
jgi:beta-lactamase regulating signal transducer with metallopeptidase domain